MGGGILPVALHDGELHFLLGLEQTKRGGWSDFGGAREGRETPRQTAIREGAEELEEAIKAATIAAEEAKRKAEKLEMLKERAELAMAKRKEKRESMQKIKEKDREDEMKKEIDATETKRKAEKLEMLKKQAEAVMEARRKKKLQQ